MVDQHSFSLISNVKERADKLLSDILGVSRSRLQINMEKENILLNGNLLTKRSFKGFKKEDYLEIELEQLEQLSLLGENIPFDIIFENDDFLIVNKPVGMVVHPAPGHPNGTLMNAVVYYLGLVGEGEESDNVRPGLVHRIDKDTSGILVISKNQQSFEQFSSKFATHDIERVYTTLVWGHLKGDTGTIETSHGRDKKNRKRFSPSTRSTRMATTHFEVLMNFPHMTLVKIKLETGRTHQIRMHMSHIDHPIVNDELYGGMRKCSDTRLNKLLSQFPRQLLHAGTLGFELFGEKFHFDVDLPDDMKSVIEYMENLGR